MLAQRREVQMALVQRREPFERCDSVKRDSEGSGVVKERDKGRSRGTETSG